MSGQVPNQKTGLTLAEQETVIRFDREEQLVHVWSADPVIWRKLAKDGWEVREETRGQGGAPHGRFYATIPLVGFRWGKKRQLSEARKAAARNALAKARRPSEPGGADDDHE